MIYCSTIIARLPEEAKSQAKGQYFWDAKRKVYRRMSSSTSSTYQWYVLYEEEGNKMYVLHDSPFLQGVLDLLDLIVEMGVLS